MTPTAHLFRTTKRIKAQHPGIDQQTAFAAHDELKVWLKYQRALVGLRDWSAWQVSGPMSMGIIWRSKRDGGPYRLKVDV